jgi:uncharacterized protein YjbJ (UPF0337 family)
MPAAGKMPVVGCVFEVTGETFLETKCVQTERYKRYGRPRYGHLGNGLTPLHVYLGQLEETIMADKDRVEGSAKNIGGKLKEGIGNITGDSKMQAEGKADQAEGKVQNAIGGIKDTVRETFGSKKDS